MFNVSFVVKTKFALPRPIYYGSGLEFYAPLYDVGAMVKGKPEASAAAGLRLPALCDVPGGIGGQPGAWIEPSAVVSQPPPCSQPWAMKWLSQQQERCGGPPASSQA